MNSPVIASKTEGPTKQPFSGLPCSRSLPRRKPGVARSDREKKTLLPVYSVTPFTMLDFPGHTAAIIWFSGCNMRCGYCHNPQIIKNKGRGRIDQIMPFFKKRKGLLDGVVLSGGEATLYPGLRDFIQILRSMEYKIKLDTNGTRPDVIEPLLEKGWLDYIALDYKAPQDKHKDITAHKHFESFSQTLDMLCAQDKAAYEVRTTVHTSLLDENDLNAMIKDLDKRNYRGTYYIQNYRSDNDRPTLGCLPASQRPLEQDKIIKPQNFSIEFRNF